MRGDPGVARITRDGKVNQMARVELDDDKDEQRAKQHIGGLEEITGPCVAGVVAEECGPGLIESAGPRT